MKLKIMSYNIAGGRSFEFGPDYRPIIHAEAQYGAYIKVEQLNRRMVETLIERIEVGKRNRETGVVPVSIFWSF